MNVENFGIWSIGQQFVAHCMNQMGLAQAHAPINKQGVVQMPRHGGHMHGRSTRHAVGRAFNKGLKSERRVESVFAAIGLHVFCNLNPFWLCVKTGLCH